MNRTIRAGVSAALLLTVVAPTLAQVAPARSAPEAASRISITDIAVTGNTLLPAAALESVLAPFKGPRTLGELKDAARAVQELYRQSGYGAVVAYLPEQPLASGKLVIAVLEGRIARVEVSGHKQFSVDNVRRSVPALLEGRTPPVQRIDAQVQLANDNPARKLALTLEEGSRSGEVDARITVTEEPVSRWAVSADNTGNVQTGRIRMGLGYQNAALLDRDHQLALQLQFAPEHPSAVAILSGSYRVPLYEAGLIWGAYGTYSNVDAGSTATAAGALQFQGKGQVLGTSLMRLLERWGEFEQRLTASLDWRDYLNNCTIEGLPAGACGTAGESVSVQPLTLDYSVQRGGERPLGLGVSVSHNLGLGGAHGSQASFEAVRPGARRGYTITRLSGFAAVPFDGNWRLALRLAAQFTGDGLVSGEQFGMAGSSSVRGYEEREIAGDSGATAALELVSPVWAETGLRAMAFADAGWVRNQLGTLCNTTSTQCTLAAVGLGARYASGPFQIKLDVAHALRAARTTERGDTRLHFQANVSFQ